LEDEASRFPKCMGQALPMHSYMPHATRLSNRKSVLWSQVTGEKTKVADYRQLGEAELIYVNAK